MCVKFSTVPWHTDLLFCVVGFGCTVNLAQCTHGHVPFRGCTGQFADSCEWGRTSFDILMRWYLETWTISS
jgi:coenzyme F420-reducing hydrogenase gamma subunit